MRLRHAIAIVCTTLVVLGAVGCRRNAGLTPAAAEAEAERNIELPISDASGQRIVIEVEPDGRYVLDETDYDLEALDEKLRQVAVDDEDTHVMVRAGKEVKYRYIIDLLDCCKKHNLRNVSFAVRREADEGGGE